MSSVEPLSGNASIAQLVDARRGKKLRAQDLKEMVRVGLEDGGGKLRDRDTFGISDAAFLHSRKGTLTKKALAAYEDFHEQKLLPSLEAVAFSWDSAS